MQLPVYCLATKWLISQKSYYSYTHNHHTADIQSTSALYRDNESHKDKGKLGGQGAWVLPSSVIMQTYFYQ